MQHVPVAALDRTFVDQNFVAKTSLTAIPYPQSAMALFKQRIDHEPFMDSTDTNSLLFVIINKRQYPLTVNFELQSDGKTPQDPYYGDWEVFPVFQGFNFAHSRVEWVGDPNTIPAGDTEADTVGVGLVGLIRTSMIYGVGGAFSLSSSDPALENPIWLGAQYALSGHDSRWDLSSIAVSDDPGAFSNNLRSFYDQRVDDTTRRASGSVALAKGQGKQPDHEYTVDVHMTAVDGTKPGWLDDPANPQLGDLTQYQCTVVVA